MFTRCPGGVCRHGHGERCLAVVTGHWRYCELTDPAHPHFDAAYVATLGEPPHAGPSPSPSPGRPSAREALAVIRSVSACPVRQTDGCGCGGKALCFRSGLPRRVYPDECRACRSAG